MRCVTIANGEIVVEERPIPEPAANEVLVRVESAGLNRADLLQQRGHYPPPRGFDPARPGLEFAGVVAAVGHAVFRFSLGDRVMGLVAGEAQAEFAVAHERQLLPVPDELGMTEAGAFSEAYLTAAHALLVQADLRVGDRVLVTGAAGGVGTAAVQLGIAAGASVIASVRSTGPRDSMIGWGVRADDPDAALLHGPYDIVIDTVGAWSVAATLPTLARGARIVVIGVGGGARLELDLLQLMNRGARISATTLRSMPLEDRAATARLGERHVLPLIRSGAVRVPIAATFPLADASSAYEWFARPGKLGKVVLLP